MANTVISLKKSATPSATPSALANGELAINYADGKLFYKAANGTIAEFSSGGGIGSESSDFGTVNVGGTLLVSDVQGDILTITAGDNIVLTPDAGGDSFSIAADLSGATDYANNTFLANTTGTFDGDLTVSGKIIANDTWNDANTTFTAIDLNVTDTASDADSLLMDLQVDSNSKFSVEKDGTVTMDGSGLTIYSTTTINPTFTIRGSDTRTVSLAAGAGLLTVSGALTLNRNSFAFINFNQGNGVSRKVDLTVDDGDDGILKQRNSTNPQTYQLYGTYTDASNYERLSISANATGSFISTEAAGTGTGRNLYISGGSNLTTQGELLFSTALVSVKHRTFALGHSSKTILYSPSDGLLRLSNDAQNDFNRLQFGGTTSSYPSIKRNGTSLEVKLADDSDYTDLAVENLTAYGNVGIGTASPAYKLEVNGDFAATTKSFVIDHPTKEGKRLRYASLEGPENGVYVRGELKGDNVIELPDYWTGLVDEDSITVNLTPIGSSQNLFVKEVKDNKVFVKSTSKTKPINCYYVVYAERKDVDKLEVEI